MDEGLWRFYGVRSDGAGASGGQIGAVHQPNTGGSELPFDFCDGAIEVDGAAGVAKNDGGQADATRIKGGVADAIIVGETDEEDAVEAAFAKVPCEARCRGAVVLEECGVGVDGTAEAFAENQLSAGDLQCGVEVGSSGALDTVIGPQSLRAVGEFDLLEGPFAGMRGGKGVVVGGVPVLGEDDVLEILRGAVDGFDDGIAVDDSECAAGAEIILHVGD